MGAALISGRWNYCLAGRWLGCLDALLQTQTRPHKDVDIIPRVPDVPKLSKLLEQQGFAVTEGTPPHAFVLTDRNGRTIDIHAVTLDAAGNGVHRMDTGGDWLFPAEALRGRGVIAGQTVDCLSPTAQVQCHAQGYVPTEKDFHDMELLEQRFKIELPSILCRRRVEPGAIANGRGC